MILNWTQADWLMAAAKPLSAWMNSFSAPVVESGPDWWLVASGANSAEHNVLAVASPAGLAASVERLRARAWPGVVCVPPESGIAAAELEALGLVADGDLPHFGLDLRGWSRKTGTLAADVRHVRTNAEFDRAIDALRRAFGWADDRPECAAQSTLLSDPAIRMYAAFRDDDVASVVVVWRGDPAYLVIMGTVPAHQGYGIGAGLVSHALEIEQSAGVSGIHLVASEAGARLYPRVGFELIARHGFWTLPASG